ncbi:MULTISPECIES: RnfABCDGE type electron transport complex subunit G [unclassified Fusibacter]|uniref:RnfABCDGE type electron transport complex subunit G n=1 Tax=unclassified Fusibacter TaxID=2624464 RepID=UPI001010C997|nr:MULTISPECIES: RnfABCDGE type electron transport complex subunit G [unclassified Fusibacter]MCK8060661.1 RnfABCDGE type electron transport complex subunit G [Fusibacter sp. A2]NPE22885.1 RnfABCDGE type electron transport complex subunit G [Fusibacter sp. A1]RXV59953.1 RnfABCDGE type electron transport complex subunit G [Fusibacter sp. A1]
MKEIIKLGLILLVICLIAAVSLAYTNGATATRIEEQKAIKSEQARKDVLPTADTFELMDTSDMKTVKSSTGIDVVVVEVYKGLSGSEIAGYVVKTLPQGYGGGLEVVTGIDLDGAIVGVRVGKHTETPGLGANATLEAYYSQYDGKQATGITVNKTQSSDTEVQAIAGATITSKAVTYGVDASGNLVESLKSK